MQESSTTKRKATADEELALRLTKVREVRFDRFPGLSGDAGLEVWCRF